MSNIVRKFRSQLVANFERDEVIEGRIIGKDVAEFDGQNRRFILVDTARAIYQVFETQAMEEPFGMAEIGDSIRIKHLATVTTKANRTFKQFDIEVWNDPSLPPVEAVKRPGRPRATGPRRK